MSRGRRHWWLFLLLMPLALGFARLRFNADVLDLLPGDLPSVQGLKLYQQHFANARELILTVRAPEGEQATKFAGALAARLRQETNLVAGVSWQPPWMEHPEQAAEIVAYLWLNQSPRVFGDLTYRLAPQHLDAVLADTRETLATSLSPLDLARRSFDPFDLMTVPAAANVGGFSAEQGDRTFASDDGTFRVLFVKARSDLASYRECAALLASVRQLVAKTRASESIEAVVRYTGRPAFVSEIAANMQRDLSGSVTATAAIIALLFWLTHRRWLPMLWLLTLLALVLAGTLALGGLVLGTVNVLSLGFAAVLLGLAVDYAVVHYQEALAHQHLSVPEIRRAIAPSILWAAITTIAAFFVLNFSGLPGLAQLGTLVGLGVALAAGVMVMVYLPPLFPNRRNAPPGKPRPTWWSFFIPASGTVADRVTNVAGARSRLALAATVLLVMFALIALGLRRPGLDKSARAIQPQQAEAQAALEEVTVLLGLPQDSLWIVVPGKDEREVQARLEKAEARLQQARSNQLTGDFLLPSALWPRAEFQEANRATARWLGEQGPRLRAAALGGGFKPEALFLTDELIRTWARAGTATGVLWPTNDMSQWLLKRFVARSTNEWLMMGVVYPPTNHVELGALTRLSSQLAEDGVLLSGWGLLGATTLERVRERLWLVVTPMVLLVLLSLWFAFRCAAEVLLGLAVLGLSGLVLLAVMGLAGWSWNLMNLMALPLVLGTGVDYSIFMQLALRRHGGDGRVVRRSVGRALLLCGGTAIAGFGSLAWSGNVGMASLGKVCAVGIAANMLIAVTLLPAWWLGVQAAVAAHSGNEAERRADKGGRSPRLDSSRSATQAAVPSSFYRAWLWQTGLAIVRWTPGPLFNAFCLLLAAVYFRLHRERRETVVRNLLPVLENDRAAANRTARRLFQQFALKLADLWRFETGRDLSGLLKSPTDWGAVEAARARGQGVLFVTPHLGNWELGATLLLNRGYKFIAVTQAEPGEGLTELRASRRALRGIETLVIGGDGFAVVELVKRLQDGAIAALLMDRPAGQNVANVELFGRPFRASLAPAELARATGCLILGVTVVREGVGYAVRRTPPFAYDRQALGNREARVAFTQEILRAFENEIRQHPEQWYHFVPIWPESAAR